MSYDDETRRLYWLVFGVWLLLVGSGVGCLAMALFRDAPWLDAAGSAAVFWAMASLIAWMGRPLSGEYMRLPRA